MYRRVRSLALLALVVSCAMVGTASAQDAPDVPAEQAAPVESEGPADSEGPAESEAAPSDDGAAPAESNAASAGDAPAVPPAVVSLAITSEPVGASISINGRRLGVTPTTLQMPAGPVTIALELGGYVPWSKTVELGAGGAAISASLEPRGEEGPTPE